MIGDLRLVINLFANSIGDFKLSQNNFLLYYGSSSTQQPGTHCNFFYLPSTPGKFFKVNLLSHQETEFKSDDAVSH